MLEILSWAAILVVVAVLAAGAVWYARGAFANGSSPFFRAKIEPRIDIVEHTAMDSKRRLVLIRRDNVEHLIMTGGPVDVVIETGITPPERPLEEINDIQPATAGSVFSRPSFSRPSMGFGGGERAPIFAGRRTAAIATPMPTAHHESHSDDASVDAGIASGLKAERS